MLEDDIKLFDKKLEKIGCYTHCNTDAAEYTLAYNKCMNIQSLYRAETHKNFVTDKHPYTKFALNIDLEINEEMKKDLIKRAIADCNPNRFSILTNRSLEKWFCIDIELTKKAIKSGYHIDDAMAKCPELFSFKQLYQNKEYYDFVNVMNKYIELKGMNYVNADDYSIFNQMLIDYDIPPPKEAKTCIKCAELGTKWVKREFYCIEHVPRCTFTSTVGRCQRVAEYAECKCENHRVVKQVRELSDDESLHSRVKNAYCGGSCESSDTD